MRVSPIPVARAVGAVYVNWIRNTPLTLVMFFFAFCVPLLLPGRANFLVLAIWALGIYTATYVAETIRSGINTVPVGPGRGRARDRARRSVRSCPSSSFRRRRGRSSRR